MVPFSALGQIQAFLTASRKINFATDLMTASMDLMSVPAQLRMRDEVRIIIELFKFKTCHLFSSYCSNNWIAGMLRPVRHCPWLYTQITVRPVTHVMFPCPQKSPASCQHSSRYHRTNFSRDLNCFEVREAPPTYDAAMGYESTAQRPSRSRPWRLTRNGLRRER